MRSPIILSLQLSKLSWRTLRNLHSNVLSPKVNISYAATNVISTKLRIFHNKNNLSSCLNCKYVTKPRSKQEIPGLAGNNYSQSFRSEQDQKEQQQKQHEQQEEKPIDVVIPSEKLGLFAKFKLMYKQYWYVLIPVHVITSIGWFGGFYYLSKSGVDIPSLLQTLHISESIIEKLKGSDMGHIAVAYLCYKLATPARYAVTVGGTTISIKYLVQAGYIKPMPTRTELIRMYEEKKTKRKQEKESRNQ